jgi:type VI secretion system protein ImpM
MSSVDAVGRYFPLVVCGEVRYPRTLLAEVRGGGNWYARIGRIMMACLSPQATLDGFENALQTCPFPLHAGALEASGSELADVMAQASHGHVGTALMAAPIGGALSLLEVEMTLGRFAGLSLWWAPLPSGHTKAMMCQGMPRPDQYVQMLLVD